MRAVQDGRWECRAREVRSEKQLFESESRLRTLSCWEDRACRLASHSRWVTLGKCLPLSAPQFTLPWKDISFHHLWGHAHLGYGVRSHRRRRSKAGPQPPESHPSLLLRSGATTLPDLVCPLPHSVTPLLQPPHQYDKAQLRGTGIYQGQHTTVCRALSHPTSPPSWHSWEVKCTPRLLVILTLDSAGI